MSVLNISHYDSDNENDEFGGGKNEDFLVEREVTPDELTEDLQEMLDEKLSEIGTVSVVGKNSYRIDFFDTDFTFEGKTCQCDFDLDADKMPIMHDGGQEFIIPYLYDLKEFYPDLHKSKFQTNNNFTFKIV